MKRIVLLILTICFCFIASAGLAEDYWVYIRTYDRPTVDSVDISNGTYGRSKKGDIVQILPVTPQFVPSEREKKSYAIVRVTNITQKNIDKYTKIWEVEDGVDIDGNAKYKKVADRLYTLDIDTLNIKIGLHPQVVDFKNILEQNISQKTSSHLISYLWGYRKYVYIEKPIKTVSDFFIRPAFAETVSTINKTGEDYNTLTLWESDKDGDLVTDTRQETAECYDDDGALNDYLRIFDSTTSDEYYFKVTTPLTERHSGVTSDGSSGNGFKLYSTSDNDLIYAQENYSQIIGLILNLDIDSADDRRVVATYPYATVAYNIIEKGANAGSGTVDGIVGGILGYNNIVYNIDGEGMNGDGDINVDFYNNTVYNCGGNGITSSSPVGGIKLAKNNVIVGSGGSDFNDGFDTNNNNATEDETGDITGITTAVFESVGVGTEDLHIVSGASDLIEAAEDLSGTFTDDIDGDTRVAWDIGADEYVAVAAGRTRRFF